MEKDLKEALELLVEVSLSGAYEFLNDEQQGRIEALLIRCGYMASMETDENQET